MTPALFYALTTGDLVATAVSDDQMSASLFLLSDITSEEAERLQRNAGLASPEAITIGAYLIRGRGYTVLVDTDTGGVNSVGGALIVNLALLDVRPEEIDTVLLTHMHPDHIDGLLTTTGASAYPNATVFLPSQGRTYWLAASTLDDASDHARRNVLPVHRILAICAAQIREVDGEETVTGVHLCSLPGHTPGHTGYHLEAGNTSLLIWGDIVYLPTVQITRPLVSVAFDVDPEQARQTRGCLPRQTASEQWLIASMHLGLPGFARVVETPSSYLLQSV